MYTYVHIHMYTYVSMHICVRTYIHICTYIYIHMYVSSRRGRGGKFTAKNVTVRLCAAWCICLLSAHKKHIVIVSRHITHMHEARATHVNVSCHLSCHVNML